ncbi:MAG: rRNA maturation RNase YbeY, partial [Candidatus Omnitrophota bacterium]
MKKIFLLLHITSKKISFVLCDNTLIQNLNKRFLKKNEPTDVIAFPLKYAFDPDHLGEVVVSVEEAALVAGSRRDDWERELLLYCIHGVLHLLGYDDRTNRQRTIMRKKEQAI